MSVLGSTWRADPADHGAGSGAGPHRTGADRAAAGSMTNERLLSRELSAAGGRRSSAAEPFAVGLLPHSNRHWEFLDVPISLTL